MQSSSDLYIFLCHQIIFLVVFSWVDLNVHLCLYFIFTPRVSTAVLVTDCNLYLANCNDEITFNNPFCMTPHIHNDFYYIFVKSCYLLLLLPGELVKK